MIDILRNKDIDIFKRFHENKNDVVMAVVNKAYKQVWSLLLLQVINSALGGGRIPVMWI